MPKLIHRGPTVASPKFMTAFGALFVLPGLAAVISGLVKLGSEPKTGALIILFGATFVIAGGSLMVYALAGSRGRREVEEQAEQHPDEPWLWNTDWEDGVVRNDARFETLGFWAFTILWNLISVPLLYFAWQNSKDTHPAIFVAAIFPLIGFVLLVAAVRRTIQDRRYGQAHLEMTTMPGVIGGMLEARVFTEEPLPDHSHYLARLRCVRKERVTNSENETSVQTVTLWEERLPVPPDRVQRNSEGTTFSVRFQIPFDCEESDLYGDTSQVHWLVECESATEGFTWKRVFTVPVFRTPESSPEVKEREASFDELEHAFEHGVIGTSRITVQTHDDGSLELFIPACRHLGLAVALWIATLVVGGAGWFFWFETDGNGIFMSVPGLIWLFLFFAALHATFLTRRLRASPDGITIDKSVLGIDTTHTIPSEDIVDIEPEISWQNEREVSYKIIARLKGYTTYKVAAGILGKPDARVVASFLMTALGREAPVED